jgi:hypothetical protein
MAGKAKAGSEALKVKAVDAKVKGKKLQTVVSSSENSELEASEDKVSSEDSTLPEPENSLLKFKRTEGTKTKRRTKPATAATPFVEVTLSFFNSCSFAYSDFNAYRRFQLKEIPGHG